MLLLDYSAEVREISRRLLDKLAQRMRDIQIGIAFDDSVVDAVCEKGYDDTYGARPVRRAVQTLVEDKLSQLVLQGLVVKGESYECSFREGDIKIAQTVKTPSV